MTLNELKFIVALAKSRNFRKAAEVCFVSQPALSLAVKKLEDELGVLLFERSRNDVIMTAVGELVIEQATRVIEEAKRIKEIAKQGNNQHDPPTGNDPLGYWNKFNFTDFTIQDSHCKTAYQ
jgi:LysR family hydrogen peroxide-inducible transcriptional activator